MSTAPGANSAPSSWATTSGDEDRPAAPLHRLGLEFDREGRHGGLEVVDLIHGTTQYYDSSTIAIPADSQTAIEIVSHGNNNYRLWLGTTNGLAYCNLRL